MIYQNQTTNMRNLLFFITIFSLFSCNNTGKKEEMALLNYSTNTYALQGFQILKSMEYYCFNHRTDEYAKKKLVNAHAIEKKYNNLSQLVDSINDIELMRKELLQFNKPNNFFLKECDNFEVSNLSSKEYLKNAFALIFYNTLKELNRDLVMPDCSVHPFYQFDIFANSDSIKLNEEFVGVITRERFYESFGLTALLKNNYKVNFIKRNGVKVNDVKLNILAKNRILKLKPAKKGHYEIEVSFTVVLPDSSTSEYPTPIVFDVY